MEQPKSCSIPTEDLGVMERELDELCAELIQADDVPVMILLSCTQYSGLYKLYSKHTHPTAYLLFSSSANRETGSCLSVFRHRSYVYARQAIRAYEEVKHLFPELYDEVANKGDGVRRLTASSLRCRSGRSPSSAAEHCR